jgi:hypothetical protein
MSREYKNILHLRTKTFGQERRRNLTKEVVQNATPLPQPLEYQDIDEEFKRWVDEDLGIIFDGEKVPTFTLLSNQRFSEYMQSWEHVDEKKNLILNFKSITRENNPKLGSIVGDTRNIPGDIDFLMKRVQAVDKAGNKYFIEYRTKQPIPIDLIYTVSIFTNKYEMLNKFNQLVNGKFKAIECYIRPNGHFIPMKLDDISDESEYSIDNRRFYSQTYLITVMAYIMPKENFSTVEVPAMKFEIYDGDGEDRMSYAEIEEIACGDEIEVPYDYSTVVLNIHVPNCKTATQFTIDCEFKGTGMKLTNVKFFNLFINDKKIDFSDGYDFEKDFEEYVSTLELRKGDIIRVSGVTRNRSMDDSKIEIFGYDYTNVTENRNDKLNEIIEIEEKC